MDEPASGRTPGGLALRDLQTGGRGAKAEILATALRDAAAITIFYRLDGEH
jgi:hypothetical protein